MRDLPAEEKPRERLEQHGARALSSGELLALILRSGGRGVSALDLGREIMKRFGSLSALDRATLEELQSVRGLGRAKAIEIKAALELGRRLTMGGPPHRPTVSGPSDAAELLAEMGSLDQEHFKVVLLDTKNHVLGDHYVYKGSLNSSFVRAADVFREAVRRNCASIIIAHNHPSGDPTPSAEDIKVTRQLAEAGKLLEVEVLDHLIMAGHRWTSLREAGLGFS
jgi:DNA repair protein RadC